MYAVPSVLIEIADRVAALEEASSELTGTIASADSDIERRLTALESQHNLMVDNITNLQGCVNQLEAAATQPPATAGGLVDRIMETVMLDPGRAVRAIHAAPFTPIPVSERLPGAEDCDAKERCWWGDAGDDEFVPSWRLCEQPDKSCFDHWLPHWAIRLPQPLSSAPKTGSESSLLRAVYNLGRQHGAQARQEGEMVPVLWVRKKAGPGCNASVIAWLPSVGDLPIGEHILYAFPGTSQPRQEEEATPPPAPAGGLVERVVGVTCKTCNLELEARAAIHAVADWLQQRSSTIANGSQWAEMLRREADR
jgi:hypothetical protein